MCLPVFYLKPVDDFYKIKNKISGDLLIENRRLFIGAPEGIRTPGPLLRRQLLYPTELQARMQLKFYLNLKK